MSTPLEQENRSRQDSSPAELAISVKGEAVAAVDRIHYLDDSIFIGKTKIPPGGTNTRSPRFLKILEICISPFQKKNICANIQVCLFFLPFHWRNPRHAASPALLLSSHCNRPQKLDT